MKVLQSKRQRLIYSSGIVVSHERAYIFLICIPTQKRLSHRGSCPRRPNSEWVARGQEVARFTRTALLITHEMKTPKFQSAL